LTSNSIESDTQSRRLHHKAGLGFSLNGIGVRIHENNPSHINDPHAGLQGVKMTSENMKRNHAAWIGPLIALVGLVTYFSVAVKVPDLRDSAVLNLFLVSFGIIVAVWGIMKRRNWKSWAGLVGAGAFASLLFAYVFVLSSQMPGAESAPTVGSMAPPLVLPDQNGRLVRLGDLLDRRVVVVFYRGFW
jgi:hypothetical protein